MSVEPELHRPAPPPGEEIHLPGPTALPVVTAVAITLVVVGTTMGWWLSAVGGLVLIVCVARWIADTRRDIDELPDEHR
jgi:hypothetical protein